jgi:hypothetical protein
MVNVPSVPRFPQVSDMPPPPPICDIHIHLCADFGEQVRSYDASWSARLLGHGYSYGVGFDRSLPKYFRNLARHLDVVVVRTA